MTVETQIEDHGQENAKAWYESIIDMLRALNTEDDNAREDAEQIIHESVLSVEVRSDWHLPGQPFQSGGEYNILLTTGGPALRIIGQLNDYCEPHSAELQYQDWGTPWTRYPSPEADLLKFAQCFYFGD
jgi:hypothetical protein